MQHGAASSCNADLPTHKKSHIPLVAATCTNSQQTCCHPKQRLSPEKYLIFFYCVRHHASSVLWETKPIQPPSLAQSLLIPLGHHDSAVTNLRTRGCAPIPLERSLYPNPYESSEGKWLKKQPNHFPWLAKEASMSWKRFRFCSLPTLPAIRGMIPPTLLSYSNPIKRISLAFA